MNDRTAAYRADGESRLRVSCLGRVGEVASAWHATHIISLLDPCLPASDVPRIASVLHFVSRCYDQECTEATAHFRDVVCDAMNWIDKALRHADTKLLLHCHAGVSRSTAYALGAICVANPGISDVEAMECLLLVCEKPWPNRRIVEEIDIWLERNGRLVKALDGYRALHPKRLRAYRVLNARRGLVSPVSR